MGAVVSRFVPGFNAINIPLDFGRSIHGERIVGEHKTWGGFLCGVLVGTLVGVFKYVVVDPYLKSFQVIHLNFWENCLLYTSLSFAALAGDVIKSVCKRLLNIAPHEAWVPFDEIDHSVLSMAIAVVFFGVSLDVAVYVVFIFFFLHMLSNIVGYLLKIKPVPY